jgi:hypothetical protein
VVFAATPETPPACLLRAAHTHLAPPQVLSYNSYLTSGLTDWTAHAGSVHPAMPGDKEAILNVPLSSAVWDFKGSDTRQVGLHVASSTPAFRW